jgi:hypothetical protein
VRERRDYPLPASLLLRAEVKCNERMENQAAAERSAKRCMQKPLTKRNDATRCMRLLACVSRRRARRPVRCGALRCGALSSAAPARSLPCAAEMSSANRRRSSQRWSNSSQKTWRPLAPCDHPWLCMSKPATLNPARLRPSTQEPG